LFFALWVEHKQRVLENKIVRSIFVPKRAINLWEVEMGGASSMRER